MQITFAILCFGIVLLEFLWCPWQLDRGYNAVTDVSFSGLKQSDYPISSGLALVRKWDGKKYVDDNNTTADFEVKVASLSRRDEKGNAIK